jgi:hypothetical protein
MTGRRYLRTSLKRAADNVNKDIASFANSGDNFYSRGLASEGYNGGYRDALYDVMLAIDGILPNRNNWWEEDGS